MKNAIAKMFCNIADLFKVKTILSLLVVGTICILTLKEGQLGEAFIAIASAIVTYYFTKDSKKEITEQIEEEVEKQIDA